MRGERRVRPRRKYCIRPSKQAAVSIDRKTGKTDARMPTIEQTENTTNRRKHSQSRIPSQIQRKIRKSNTGCLYQISVNLREGSICPRLSGGKRKKCNVYAETREQAKANSAERIEKANAEIAEQKKRQTHK